MKKILLTLSFLFALLLTSCNLDDDSYRAPITVLVPIENVEIPEQFVYGETYEINLTYTIPNSCYVFNDIYYQSESNERTVAIICTVYEEPNCLQEATSEEVSFNFMANSLDTYVFKFWQGEDENGNDMFYIVEVPVTEEATVE